MMWCLIFFSLSDIILSNDKTFSLGNEWKNSIIVVFARNKSEFNEIVYKNTGKIDNSNDEYINNEHKIQGSSEAVTQI